MRGQAKEKTVHYMKEHNILTLATCQGNRPHATTVSYVNEGLTIYFATGEGTTKVHDIEANPNVALTIDEDYPNPLETRGIQYEGKAEVLKDPAEILAYP